MAAADGSAVPERLLALAVETASDAMTAVDADGVITLWNAAAVQLTGVAAQRAIGVRPGDLFEMSGQRGAIADGTTVRREWSVGIDGRTLDLEVEITALSESGEPAAYLVVARDLRATRLSQAANRLLGTIARSTRECIVAADKDGNIGWANEAALEMYGWTGEELIGQHMSVLVPPEELEGQAGRMGRALTGEMLDPYIVTSRRRDGALIEVSVVLGPLMDPDGTIHGLATLLRDVTDMRKNEREAARARELGRARFDQVSMPQALVSRAGSILSVNDAFCALTGHAREELIGQPIRSLIHAADPNTALKELQPLLEGHTDSATYERVAEHASGRPLPVLLDVTMLRDGDGEAFAMAIFAQDLTEVREAQRRLAAQESLFHALSAGSSDASLVIDADSNVVYVSPAVQTIFGYTEADVVLNLSWDVIHSEDLATAEPIAERVLTEPGSSHRMVVRVRTAAGDWRWVEITLTNRLDDPDVRGLIANLRDVHAQVEAQRAVSDSEELHRAIINTAQEGIIAITGEGDTILANDTLARILGVSLEEVYRTGAMGLVPDEMFADFAERVRTGRLTGTERVELPYRHPDGTMRVLSLSGSPLRTKSEGRVGALAMVSDVTDARHVEERLRWQALHDALTGLPNRALLVDRLETAAARQERTNGAGVAVLFIDLDGFKKVNDLRGHEVGDEVLKAVARRLEAAVRRTDTVSRLGGDEFAVVCDAVGEELALEIAHRVCDSLNEPLEVEGETVEMGASIGVALFPPNAPEDLLRLADASMYAAKHAGGARVVLYDPTTG